MKITVLIPTYRRPEDLKRCLVALQQQERPADEVLLVIRDIDDETHTFLKTFNSNLPLHTITVTVPGVVAAMNLGFDTAKGDIIAITDDDAAPHPDWLNRIEMYFQTHLELGGLGGRDCVYLGTQLLEGAKPIVGKLQWFGRMVGDHHLGAGSVREVDLLKGVNMSFRKQTLESLRCDQRLKGTGAQVHFEVALCLSIKQQGWKLMYDPGLLVDHYPAQRFDEDKRATFSAIAATNTAHNETLVLLDHFTPLRQIIYLVWAVLVGTRLTPGLVQLIRFLPQEGSLAIEKFYACMQGRWQGWQTWYQTRCYYPRNTHL